MAVLPQGTVKGLAEIVLRVKDIDIMQSFYKDVIGLVVLRRFGDEMIFFKLPDGLSDRPQTLALFSKTLPANAPHTQWTALETEASTMHHFALSVTLSDLIRARELLMLAQVPVHDRIFAWAGWRSLMIADPEGNVVELVASDPSIHQPISN